MYDACPGSALCRLLLPGAGLWMVRPNTIANATPFGILLLQHVSGLLVVLGAEVAGRG